MKSNSQVLDTIYCDKCGTILSQSNGRFLRPVLILCRSCEERTKFYPEKMQLDKKPNAADKRRQ